jgi:tetratricopeptide (TPR) repeat protein
MKSLLILGSVAALVAVAPAAAAKSPAEIEQIAQAVSVEMITGVGSGVIVHRQGNLYTVITNSHVVCKVKKLCTDREIRSVYRLKTPDGRVYQVSKSDIKLLQDSAGKALDLAIVQFSSDRNYQVAKVANPDSLKLDDAVYTAGFPAGQGWLFGSGRAKAVVNKRLNGDQGGYTVIYNSTTLPGMSGGGAFDKNGRLVAVHGRGDQYTENTQAEVEPSRTVKAEVYSKIGINRGIPVRWVVQGLSTRGILLGEGKPLNRTNVEKATADEFFIAGFNKLVGASGDFRAEKREAVAQFSRAIALNPRYTIAYFMRAVVKSHLNDSQGALADFDTAISLDPKDETAYYNRGTLKQEQLNNPQGALADYNNAILLDRRYAEAYYNRGILKQEKLNNLPGALADYDTAILLSPKFAPAYINRGNLKYEKNDLQGALADYDKAISLKPELVLAYFNRGTLKAEKLNDFQGALADYDKAISLQPEFAPAYFNRGNLKQEKLSDFRGALADYNTAISLNPKYVEVYANRAKLKYEQLNDRQGAIGDLRTAARILREQGQTQRLQVVTDVLHKLGVTEMP